MAYTVTALGTGSIQPYIFGSNFLRENIGASELVARATTIWALEALVGRREAYDFQVDLTTLKPDYGSETIESGNVTAEVIYAGGGNTVLIFGGDDSLERARKFVYGWSRLLLEKAPGLDVYAAHESYDWGDSDKSLAKAVSTAMEEIGRWRGELPGTQATLGLSVTAACSSTGLPANEPHPSEDKAPTLANIANQQVKVKWETESKLAKGRLQKILPLSPNDELDFDWTADLEKIGQLPKREDSFIAVVHADGNGMGKRILLLGEIFEQLPQYPRAYITAMRKLSKKLNKTAEKALIKTVIALVKTLRAKKAEKEQLFFSEGTKNYFPFRPIVFGGDDVTWVCAGPFGISMAQRYLMELEKHSLPKFADLLAKSGIPDEEAQTALSKFEKRLPASDKPYACAGVAIVKTHYPFAQAYGISEELAKSAKNRVYTLRGKKDKLGSAIDWHYTTTGLTARLKDIREREYATAELNEHTGRLFSLLARPYVLNIEKDDLGNDQYTWRNWDSFYEMWQWFKRWFDQRSKMMALRDALRSGPTAVAQFEQAERIKGGLPHHEDMRHTAVNAGPLAPFALDERSGWMRQKNDAPTDQEMKALWQDEERAIFFDAIELEKLFVELVDTKTQEAGDE